MNEESASTTCPPPTGCYLLIVLGRPINNNHREQILQKVAKGLLSWDTQATQCDLRHLEEVCGTYKSRELGIESDLLLQHATDKCAVEVLLNPHIFTIKQCIRNLLLSPTRYMHIIHSGYSFHESGSWILQDGIYSCADFLDEFGEPQIITKLSQHSDDSLQIHLHCDVYGEWAQLCSSNSKTDGGPRRSTFKLPSAINLQLNPPDSSSGVPGAANLLEFLEDRLRISVLDVSEGMEPSPLVGNIRFDKPTVYIFPAGQGNCSLFGIRGFTMLIDGGYTRYPCFWKFVRHIERLDSMLITRIDENNCLSLLSLLRSEKTRSMFQRVGNVFANLGDDNEINGMKDEKSSVDDGDVLDDLSINIMQVGKHIRRNLLSQNCSIYQCWREPNISPITLYQKIGHGTLLMFPLNPSKDSRLLMDFLANWSSKKDKLSMVRIRSATASVSGTDRKNIGRSDVGSGEISVPICDVMSISCLIVWISSDPKERLTRILFPGSAPQSQIFEGLGLLAPKLEMLQYRVCLASNANIFLQDDFKHSSWFNNNNNNSNNNNNNNKSSAGKPSYGPENRSRKMARFRSVSPGRSGGDAKIRSASVRHHIDKDKGESSDSLSSPVKRIEQLKSRSSAAPIKTTRSAAEIKRAGRELHKRQEKREKIPKQEKPEKTDKIEKTEKTEKISIKPSKPKTSSTNNRQQSKPASESPGHAKPEKKDEPRKVVRGRKPNKTSTTTTSQVTQVSSHADGKQEKSHSERLSQYETDEEILSVTISSQSADSVDVVMDKAAHQQYQRGVAIGGGPAGRRRSKDPDSLEASPFRFGLRDDVEPDSLEVCYLDGQVSMSKDSLDHSEDEAMTVESRSVSKMDQNTSRDEGDSSIASAHEIPLSPAKDNSAQSMPCSETYEKDMASSIISTAESEKTLTSSQIMAVSSLCDELNEARMAAEEKDHEHGEQIAATLSETSQMKKESGIDGAKDSKLIVESTSESVGNMSQKSDSEKISDQIGNDGGQIVREEITLVDSANKIVISDASVCDESNVELKDSMDGKDDGKFHASDAGLLSPRIKSDSSGSESHESRETMVESLLITSDPDTDKSDAGLPQVVGELVESSSTDGLKLPECDNEASIPSKDNSSMDSVSKGHDSIESENLSKVSNDKSASIDKKIEGTLNDQVSSDGKMSTPEQQTEDVTESQKVSETDQTPIKKSTESPIISEKLESKSSEMEISKTDASISSDVTSKKPDSAVQSETSSTSGKAPCLESPLDSEQKSLSIDSTGIVLTVTQDATEKNLKSSDSASIITSDSSSGRKESQNTASEKENTSTTLNQSSEVLEGDLEKDQKELSSSKKSEKIELELSQESIHKSQPQSLNEKKTVNAGADQVEEKIIDKSESQTEKVSKLVEVGSKISIEPQELSPEKDETSLSRESESQPAEKNSFHDSKAKSEAGEDVFKSMSIDVASEDDTGPTKSDSGTGKKDSTIPATEDQSSIKVDQTSETSEKSSDTGNEPVRKDENISTLAEPKSEELDGGLTSPFSKTSPEKADDGKKSETVTISAIETSDQDKLSTNIDKKTIDNSTSGFEGGRKCSISDEKATKNSQSKEEKEIKSIRRDSSSSHLVEERESSSKIAEIESKEMKTSSEQHESSSEVITSFVSTSDKSQNVESISPDVIESDFSTIKTENELDSQKKDSKTEQIKEESTKMDASEVRKESGSSTIIVSELVTKEASKTVEMKSQNESRAEPKEEVISSPLKSENTSVTAESSSFKLDDKISTDSEKIIAQANISKKESQSSSQNTGIASDSVETSNGSKKASVDSTNIKTVQDSAKGDEKTVVKADIKSESLMASPKKATLPSSEVAQPGLTSDKRKDSVSSSSSSHSSSSSTSSPSEMDDESKDRKSSTKMSDKVLSKKRSGSSSSSSSSISSSSSDSDSPAKKGSIKLVESSVASITSKNQIETQAEAGFIPLNIQASPTDTDQMMNVETTQLTKSGETNGSKIKSGASEDPVAPNNERRTSTDEVDRMEQRGSISTTSGQILTQISHHEDANGFSFGSPNSAFDRVEPRKSSDPNSRNKLTSTTSTISASTDGQVITSVETIDSISQGSDDKKEVKSEIDKEGGHSRDAFFQETVRQANQPFEYSNETDIISKESIQSKQTSESEVKISSDFGTENSSVSVQEVDNFQIESSKMTSIEPGSVKIGLDKSQSSPQVMLDTRDESIKSSEQKKTTSDTLSATKTQGSELTSSSELLQAFSGRRDSTLDTLNSSKVSLESTFKSISIDEIMTEKNTPRKSSASSIEKTLSDPLIQVFKSQQDKNLPSSQTIPKMGALSDSFESSVDSSSDMMLTEHTGAIERKSSLKSGIEKQDTDKNLSKSSVDRISSERKSSTTKEDLDKSAMSLPIASQSDITFEAVETPGQDIYKLSDSAEAILLSSDADKFAAFGMSESRLQSQAATLEKVQKTLSIGEKSISSPEILGLDSLSKQQSKSKSMDVLKEEEGTINPSDLIGKNNGTQAKKERLASSSEESLDHSMDIETPDSIPEPSVTRSSIDLTLGQSIDSSGSCESRTVRSPLSRSLDGSQEATLIDVESKVKQVEDRPETKKKSVLFGGQQVKEFIVTRVSPDPLTSPETLTKITSTTLPATSIAQVSHHLNVEPPSSQVRRGSQITGQAIYEEEEEQLSPSSGENITGSSEATKTSESTLSKTMTISEPLVSQTVLKEYPEVLNISGGTTPSTPGEPFSPKDARLSTSASATSFDRIASMPSAASSVTEIASVSTSVSTGSNNKDGSKATLCCFPRTTSVDEIEEKEKISTSNGGQIEVDSKSEIVQSALISSIESSVSPSSGSNVTSETVAVTETSTISSTEEYITAERNLTMEQEKIKQDTLKEWGKPLGLPKASEAENIRRPTSSKPKGTRSKSSSRATGRTSPATTFVKQMKPIYVELAYIPNHGDRHYCNLQFFNLVRARYYVLSAVNPSREVLDALIEGKKLWDNKAAEVVLIPTHETEALCLWMANNRQILEDMKIEIAPSASRCTVMLQDQESTCAAYRVEF
ncbi:uncharacterized protein LOC141852938 [Brevipalpus obovatus]|uniref:uncharacterized protein LOC141852938 n=1 Tax=Brevipalpus obovatus TaxID=246614 RepID=UPI003D9DB337